MFLDPAIIRALPTGAVVLNVHDHGEARSAKGLKVEIEIQGKKKAYFLKIMEGDTALLTAIGEYESHVAMQQHIPENMAQAVAVGPLEEDNSKAFFIVGFKNMDTLKPSPQKLAAVLAKMHRASESPTGKFGFPVPTYKGYLRVNNGWCDKWEDWFSREFNQTLQDYYSRRGEDPEFARLSEEFSAKVIPRLLRPLETGGRTLKPTLCHSDLWHGNAAVDRDTKKCIIFDPCCLYGHNEGKLNSVGRIISASKALTAHVVDLSFFRCPQYGWSDEYILEYIQQVQPTEPEADFDDRNALYAMRNYIVSATLWDHWLHMVDHVKAEMRRLIAKHPDGLAGFKEPEA